MAHSGPNADGSSSHASQSVSQSVNGWQSDYVESLYAQYCADPNSVGAEWRQFFLGFELDRRFGDAEELASLPGDFRRAVHRCWRFVGPVRPRAP